MAEPPAEPMVVPYLELEPGTLARVIESFVLREGTDYGDVQYSLGQKVEHVMTQLRRGDAHILFDPESESIDIRVLRGLRRDEVGRDER